MLRWKVSTSPNLTIAGVPRHPDGCDQFIHLFCFNFASSSIVFKRLARRLHPSLCAFRSVIREYLDPAVRTDRYAQKVRGIGLAAQMASELKANVEIVF